MTPEQLKEFGAVVEAVDNLKEELKETRDELKGIRLEMAKGKGIVVGMLLIASAIGGLVSMAANAFINKLLH